MAKSSVKIPGPQKQSFSKKRLFPSGHLSRAAPLPALGQTLLRAGVQAMADGGSA